MLVFKNVTKIYPGGVVALNQVSFEIRPGEFVALVGRSGAGKTTVFKLITLEEKLTRGKIFYKNRDYTTLKPWEINYLRRKIATIFQEFNLINRFNVFENVAFAMEVCGFSEQEIKQDVPKILELVGLASKQKFFPYQLSGGEKQRVAIARALVHKPEIILADEPTGNLDPITAKEIIDLLKKINQLGTTIILSTHNKEVVNHLRTRTILLDEGKIIRDEIKGSYTLA